MKVVVYNVQPLELEYIALANGKVHDLTLISNALNEETKSYAKGKDVVIVSGTDLLDNRMLAALNLMGIKKIMTRSKSTEHIDLVAAGRLNIQVANAPFEDQSLEGIANQTIRNISLWNSGKCVGSACCCLNDCAKKEVKK